MIEAPKPSEIGNVFGLHQPHHMLSKLLWEIYELTNSMSVWEESGSWPVPMFQAFNTAVTAWHITDWLWQSNLETRTALRKRYGIFEDETQKGLRKGLEAFQNAVAKENRSLYICREIANGSKHMRTTKREGKIRAMAKWDPVVDGAGLVKPGDLVMSLRVADGDAETDAEMCFINALGYWERLFNDEKLLVGKARLPDKIIKASEPSAAKAF